MKKVRSDYSELSRDVLLRAATGGDSDRIAELNNSHLDPEQPSGFLITKMTSVDVQQLIKSMNNKLTVATTLSGDVIGFLQLSDTVGEEILRALVWSSPKWKGILEHCQSYYIEKIAVEQSWLRMGIGTRLYEHAFQKWPASVFYAFVVCKPFYNEASIRFHVQQDFKKVAVFRTKKFHGLLDYESVMFARGARSHRYQ